MTVSCFGHFLPATSAGRRSGSRPTASATSSACVWPSSACWLVLTDEHVGEVAELLQMGRHGGQHSRLGSFSSANQPLNCSVGEERILVGALVDRQRRRRLRPVDVALGRRRASRSASRRHPCAGCRRTSPSRHSRGSGRTCRRARSAWARRRNRPWLHLLGDGDQRVRVLVEHGAGAGIEAGDDLVEAPVHAVLRRIAVLVDVDQELQALDPARLVEGRGAVLVEAARSCRSCVAMNIMPAVEAARAAAQAVAVLAAERGDLLRRRP